LGFNPEFWSLSLLDDESDEKTRRRRDRGKNDDQNKSKNTNQSEVVYKDQYGTSWTTRVRQGCALLGGFSQIVRGVLEQMQYEVNRARGEFDLAPGPLPSVTDFTSGWQSRESCKRNSMVSHLERTQTGWNF
jgi:hypothetical protein